MVSNTNSEPASPPTIDIALTSPNWEGIHDHAADPLGPSSIGSSVRRKGVACDHCRQRKRRCTHGYGNIDPSRATEAKAHAAPPTNKTTLSNQSLPREKSFHDPNVGLVGIMHSWESVHDSTSDGGLEGFGSLKILDPEEDLTIRPHFPDRGPFGRLIEASESMRAVTGNPAYKTPVSRKKSQGGSALKVAVKKELPDSEGNTTVGAPYIALDLSDENLSSPKSRKHKLTARRTPDRSQLSSISSKEARPKMHIGGSNRNAQNLSITIATMNSLRNQSTNSQQGIETQQYPSSGDSLPNEKWPVSAKGKESGQIQRTITADTALLTTEPFWPEKHKRSLALAAQKALFENPFNAIRKIFTTEILAFLSETSSYEDLCKRFESKRFRVDRVLLAQRLLAAVPDMQNLACFTQSNPHSVAMEITVNRGIDQQEVDQGLSAQRISEIPRSTHEPANSVLLSTAAEVNCMQPVPPLRAPVANMTIRSLPSNGLLDEDSSGSPNVDETYVIKGEPSSVAPQHLVENSTGGINSELISSTLFQMENLIQSQRRREEFSAPIVSDVRLNSSGQAEEAKNLEAQNKRDAILRDEARRVLGNSRSVFKNQSGSRGCLKISSPSQDNTKPVNPRVPQMGMTANPNTNNSEDPVRLQTEPLPGSPLTEIKYNPLSPPDIGESDLFLPDLEPAVVREECNRSTSEHLAFGQWANRNGETRIVTKKRPLEGPTLLDFFTPDKRTELIARTHTRTTLEEGHFARHQERKRALVEVAKRQKFSYDDQLSDQDGFDGQEIDIDAVADACDRTNQARPTTGGKGISKATMSQWDADTTEEREFDLNDSENDEGGLGEPEVLYHYHVHRREWLTNQNESDAPVQVLGPYFTMAEANAVAAASVKKPTQENSNRIFRPGAWSYSYTKDDHGMETHAAGSGGGSIETSVTRVICPPQQEIRPPAGVFRIPRVIYLAMLQPLSLASTDSEDSLFGDMQPEESTTPTRTLATTLKACTTLSLANKAAGQKWLELQTRDFISDNLDNLKRARLETLLRKDFRRMEEQNVSFDRTYCDERSGEKTHIWVEMVDIDGPRN